MLPPMTTAAKRNGSGLFVRPAFAASSVARLTESLPALLAAVARHASAAATASAIADEFVLVMGARSAVVYLADGDERTLRLEGSCHASEAPVRLDVFDRDVHHPAVRAARSRLLHLASGERRASNDT